MRSLKQMSADPFIPLKVRNKDLNLMQVRVGNQGREASKGMKCITCTVALICKESTERS